MATARLSSSCGVDSVPPCPCFHRPCSHVCQICNICCVEEKRKMRQTECFNKRHRMRDLDKLLPGLQMQKHRAVTSVHLNPRSYVIIGPHGTVRRNRSHLVPMPTPEAHTEPTQSSEKNLPAETVCQLLDSLWCNVTLVDGAQSDSGLGNSRASP
ncbi:hypothetical protein AMECASPLE_038872 [Ameca splendens]|uniref:Uncharacterized protein n=1 Tax=Ameca splendens TaxID=208324 RepID=A0ABV0Z657_9TELE